jgi:hypothetical protein
MPPLPASGKRPTWAAGQLSADHYVIEPAGIHRVIATVRCVARVEAGALVQLVKKEYPNSVKPAANLPAKGLAMAMRYWTLNADEVY